MNDWWPIIAILMATLIVVAIVRRLIRIEEKIDDLRERANDRRH